MAFKGGLQELASKHRRILVFGAGGGGDALGTVHLYLRLRDMGAEPVIGAIAWERHPIDPYPGPIPIEAMVEIEPLGYSAAIVTGKSYALRWGHEVKPQIARVAEALGVEAVFLDASKGAWGISQGLREAAEALGVEAVIALDTGGDMLAAGCEDELWSPLADAISLAGTIDSGLPAIVAIHAPGADGELPAEKVLEYISILASRRALLETTGLRLIDAEYISKIMDKVHSEASKIPVRAMLGEYGTITIRQGTRKVHVSPLQTATFLLDAEKVYEWSPTARQVQGTRGIGAASQLLNRLCIVTELDLENELNRLRGRTSSQPVPLEELRRTLRRKLITQGCQPPPCPTRRQY